MNLEAVPEKSSSSWEDLEVDGFVLGLYTFGKNFAQVQKLLESKATGEILLFYYGKFYGSAKYKTWSNYLKKRSTRCIQGKKLYSDWRLQLLLSRLIRSITDESKEQKLVDVSLSFHILTLNISKCKICLSRGFVFTIDRSQSHLLKGRNLWRNTSTRLRN